VRTKTETAALAASMVDAVVSSIEHPHHFEVVFEEYHRPIYEYLARSLGRDRADECAGDVFVTAFTIRGRYDPELGSVRAWLFGIAANLRATRARSEARGRRATRRLDAGREGHGGGIEEVEESLDGQRELSSVEAFLEQLPDTDRDVLLLYAWGALSYAEIAVATGVEVGTVRSRLSRARGRLRELIGRSGEVQG